MAEYSYKVECVVPQALIQRIKLERKIVSAEQIVKSNGLDWRTPFKMSDHVTIAGPSDDILRFVIECLETMLDKDRNPSCFLLNRKVKFCFLDTLGEKIFESRKELQEKYTPLEIEKVPRKCIQLVCSFDGYSKIRQTVDKIRDSKPSSNFISYSLDKSLVGEQIGDLGSSNTPSLANNHSAFYCSFNANKIKVCVYNASIIEVTGIDAIVNAADEDLDNNGGIAYVISAAAGTSLETECLNYLIEHGRVEVGNCFVTGSGNLKHLKGIIHAVGPRWDAYLDKKKCAMDLHDTLVHVLQTAHERKFQKIAVPPISSGKRSVPLDICAKMYVKAVMDYSKDATSNGITEVHFVDLLEDSLREIKKAHEKWLKCPYMLDSKKVPKHATYGQEGAKPREGSSYSFSNKNMTGYRMPWKYKEEEKKEELGEHFSSASLGYGMHGKDRNEVKQKERAQYSSLSSQGEEDADNCGQGPNEKLHQKETHGNHHKAGNGVSWMETGSGGKAGNLPIFGVEAGKLTTVNKFKIEKSESRQKPVDDAQVKTRSELLYKNTSSSNEKDTVSKLEEKLSDLEAKKISMIKEKRKKELEEKIRQAEEDLRVLSVPAEVSGKRFAADKSISHVSLSSIERDREEIELEQTLRELKEKKVKAVKERRKKELKEKIKQLKEDLLDIEAAFPAGSEEG